ncbi:hypothetical protein [Vibrio quintilis]|uniref:Uncharacterized protein n=1 Tax=Vibrio quintilis TaxID=1117707 RepID=A0A1M7YYE2_9VIBR|nr:hypothetical protein [Vibrio quintilis]SHO57661.1 hypothetical protein VQ7734_03431 [Vibrio quintilis]
MNQTIPIKLSGSGGHKYKSFETVILNDTKQGYQNTLLALMALCQKAEVEFHIFSEEDKKRAWADREQALQAVKAKLPEHIKLFWYCNSPAPGLLISHGLSKLGLQCKNIYNLEIYLPNMASAR